MNAVPHFDTSPYRKINWWVIASFIFAVPNIALITAFFAPRVPNPVSRAALGGPGVAGGAAGEAVVVGLVTISLVCMAIGSLVALIGLAKRRGQLEILSSVTHLSIGIGLLSIAYMLPRLPTTIGLVNAAATGDVAYVRKSLAWGVKPAYYDYSSAREQSALIEASRNGHYDIVERLLDYGVDPNQAPAVWDLPLHYAIENGHYHTAKLLMSRGAKADSVAVFDHDLHSAIGTDDVDLVDILLMLGEDINSRNTESGWTPLHLAAMIPSPKMIKHLLEKGADPAIQDLHGSSPIDLAVISLEELHTQQGRAPASRSASTAVEGTNAKAAELERAILDMKRIAIEEHKKQGRASH